MDDGIKSILFISIIVIGIVSFIGICYNSTWYYDEKVSPDGVHYWVSGKQMAPRIDANGNYVIDK